MDNLRSGSRNKRRLKVKEREYPRRSKARFDEEQARLEYWSLHDARKRAKWEQAKMGELPDGDTVDDVVTILSSHNFDFLVSGLGDQVPISDLKGKVVGLFFCSRETSILLLFQLKLMYKKLMEIGKKFQLVFVCLHRRCSNPKSILIKPLEKSFEDWFNKKYFRGQTWLALPFSQRESNKNLFEWATSLADIFPPTAFVIIRPGENIAHTRAISIFKDYGIEAYPFSKSRATEVQVARYKSLTLDEVLFSGAGADERFVYDRDGQKICASHLAGKNILLFLIMPHTEQRTFHENFQCLYEHLIARKRHDQFELLRVLYTNNCEIALDLTLEEASKRYHKKGSWLEFPYDKYDMDAVYSKLLIPFADRFHYQPMCVAFGRDGRFINMKCFSPGVSDATDYDLENFFDDRYVHAQVRKYIAKVHGWSTDGAI